MVCICSLFGRFNCCTCVITERCWRIRMQEWMLLVQVLHLALISYFLWKWRLLSVIIPDPSILIQYWRSGRIVMIFPVVFHWRMSGFGELLCHQLITGKGCEYICYIFLLFWHCVGGGFLIGIVQLLPFHGVACRGLAVKE